MEITDSIKDLQWQALTIKRKIRQKIRSLPNNPNIKRISSSPNCFVMNVSEIFGDKDQTFSAEYYDFRYQYKKMSNIIKKMDVTKIENSINEWIRTGYINYSTYSKINQRFFQNRLKLHPQVVEYLKTIL